MCPCQINERVEEIWNEVNVGRFKELWGEMECETGNTWRRSESGKRKKASGTKMRWEHRKHAPKSKERYARAVG